MLVKIDDTNLVEELIKDGKAIEINPFSEYYKNEIDERIQTVKNSLQDGQLLYEDEARNYVMDNIPHRYYNQVFDYLISAISGFIYNSKEETPAYKFIVPGDYEYVMKAVGENKRSIERLVDWLTSDYDFEHTNHSAERHFYGIKNNTSLDDAEIEYDGYSNTYSFDMIGVCSDTIDRCMRDVEGSYYREYTDWTDPTRASLESASEELKLKIEVIAHEFTSNSVQHIIFDNGKVTLNQYDKLFDKLPEDVLIGEYEDRLYEINQFTI